MILKSAVIEIVIRVLITTTAAAHESNTKDHKHTEGIQTFILSGRDVEKYRNLQIENLNDILNLFDKCLIQLINYPGVNLESIGIPVVTTRYGTAKHNDQWYAVPIEKLLSRSDLHQLFSNTTLGYQDLSTTTRNWFCTAQFYLYPPRSIWPPSGLIDQYFKLRVPEGFVNYGQHRPNQFSTTYLQRFPHSTYAIQVNEEEPNFINRFWFQFQVYRLNELHHRSNRYNALLFVMVTRGHQSQHFAKVYESIQVEVRGTIFYFRPYWHCWEVLQIHWNIYRGTPHNYKWLQHTLNGYANGSPKLVIQLDSGNPGAWPQYRAKFNIFRTHKMHYPANEIHPSDMEFAAEYFNQALMAIIFANSSFKVGDASNGPRCQKNEIDVRMLSWDRSLLYMPTIDSTGEHILNILLSTGESRFRLLTCSKHKTGLIAFKPLLKAYQQFSWLAIILCYFVAIPLMYKFQHSYGRNTDGFYVKRQVLNIASAGISILMEQSSTLFGFKNNNKSKWLLALFALVGIVLSNAFKGENINKILLPPQPITVQSVDEMLQKNYTFCDRAGGWNNYRIQGESMSPAWLGFAKEKESLRRLVTLADGEEFDQFWKMFSKCESMIALFTHANDARWKARYLRDQLGMKTDEVKESKEVFLGNRAGYRIYNNMDRAVPKRVDILFSSGIYWKWREMTQHRVNWRRGETGELYAENEAVMKQILHRLVNSTDLTLRLRGRIVTVFAIIPLGCSIALVLFLLEGWSVILRISKRFISAVVHFIRDVAVTLGALKCLKRRFGVRSREISHDGRTVKRISVMSMEYHNRLRE